MKKDFYDFEEDFHGQEKKRFRKERRLLQEGDRSQFKKTDRAQKEAPEQINATLPRGRVVSITGEGIWVDVDCKKILCSLKGLFKKELKETKNLVAVGDYVRISEGAIAQIEPRTSLLTRTDISGRKEQLIAANVDQVLVVVSVGDPPLKPALVDRYLIAAEKGNIHPIVLVNKVDLLSSNPESQELYKEFLTSYEPLGIPILSASVRSGVGIEAIRALMSHKTTAISGQSGVGKSSLINTAFGLNLKTGELAVKTAKGSHTTTTSQLLPIADGGYCVDTPGIRSFGIWNLERADVISHFHDITIIAESCRFGDCSHTTEPHCAVRQALHEGKLPILRYESFQTLLDEATGGADNRTKRVKNDE